MAIVAIPRDVDSVTIAALSDALELAKKGELLDVVIVGALNDADGPGYYRNAAFQDRWRMLGALEYAKDGVNRG